MDTNEGLTTQPEPSLREMLAENLAAVPESAPAPESTPPQTVESGSEAQVAETAEQKAGRTAGRPRDAQGRLLPGKPAKETAGQAEAATAAPVATEAGNQPAPAAPRPSTWKKEHWADYDALRAANPKLADYILQREGEYAKGVSTYNHEWQQAKPLIDAVTPYVETIQKHGLQTHEVVARTLHAHHTLALAQPQEKMAMLQQLVRDYQIPAQLAVQDAQGNWQLLGQQPVPQRQAPPQYQPQDIQKIVREQLASERTTQTVAEFERNAPEHYAVVKQDMAGLLQAGLADDLQSAYDAALRLPKHADIFEAIQEQKRLETEATQRQHTKAKVIRARAANTSVSSSTPSGTAEAGAEKGLRETIAANLAAVAGGRV